MREDDAGELARAVVVEAGVGRDLGTAPQHDGLPAGLEEDRLLHLLAVPAKRFVKGARPSRS